MRLAATENRFFGKSFPFDQNLHLLTRKSFYILVLPSNDFRSTHKREKHTQPKRNKTQEANKRSERERENDPDPERERTQSPEPFDFAFAPIAVRIAPFVVPDRHSNRTLRRPRSPFESHPSSSPIANPDSSSPIAAVVAPILHPRSRWSHPKTDRPRPQNRSSSLSSFFAQFDRNMIFFFWVLFVFWCSV